MLGLSERWAKAGASFTKGHRFGGGRVRGGGSQCWRAEHPGSPEPERPPAQTSRWRCFYFAQHRAQQAQPRC